MLEVLHHLLEIVVEYAIFMFEIVGVLILIWAGIKGIYNFLKKDPQTEWRWPFSSSLVERFSEPL